ncbi:excinuclease ABC subunit UvrA [Sinimarinibacterium sp. NLF-5-8]|uniref:excinuclease ABC subunit UvrA n=1 Tax=Sinimarinibacterium sp. NLF-5-8 TaxID=2698684 RepID=UPI00137B9F00|nr:excinuclease ABC subunit UvrA [Sinimarinibacterium sp. NLF-5-8]QHS11200.1 excinuclease ABC subunit UvrA [Sinimarinibacterium sp. NLF-5-8]
MDCIHIRGARTHNLKNISLDLPRDRLIVITGLSGSGKSSLAFDTLYAEGQRRYVESLSAYARQFLSMMQKPDVDAIEGLSPAISIEQKSTSHNPRSTVGTVTEIYDYLRLLFARVGTARCPDHGVTLEAQSVQQMVDQVLALPEDSAWLLLAPVVRGRKGEHAEWFEQARAQGFIRVRVDGTVFELDEVPTLNRKLKHDIEIVVDRFKVRADLKQRLAESFETALKLSDGLAQVVPYQSEGQTIGFSARMSCPHCGYALEELEPRLFSFNAPHGACPKCDGLGTLQIFDPARVVQYPERSLAEGAIRSWDQRNPYYWHFVTSLARHYGFDPHIPFQNMSARAREVMLYGSGDERVEFEYPDDRGRLKKSTHRFEGIIPNLERRYHETDSEAVREELAKYLSNQPCPDCGGQRLNRAARNVFVADHNLPELTTRSIEDAATFFEALHLPGHKGEIADKILKEIRARLGFLNNVGLDYLTLARSAETLSGGEAQRIRLASQIGAGLVGVLYVLDEPSIGLHQRDNERLLQTLFRLRDLGNTVIVVEHDEDAIRHADYVVDIGPGAGVHGGHVVAQGTPQQVEQAPDSVTGAYLSGRKAITVPQTRNAPREGQWISILGARGNNLQNVTAQIPIGLMTCVTGVSGSGKSTLINDTLLGFAARALNGAASHHAACDAIDGLQHLDKVIDIDQSPIGRTPRSNPATYTGLFTTIRDLFAAVPESRARGYTPGRFSFNVKGGRCETCQGDGVIKVEMHFLPDVYVTCDTCHGKRYNRETLEIRYKGKRIDEVLDMTVEDAVQFFAPVPALHRKLETLMDVGLSYITLGQNATTLSGGEAQRIKLAKELSRRGTGRTLYILDEPTTGLHFGDVAQLITVLEQLREQGNTVVIIEHNLDVIKRADWLIDLGPEGGSGGGQIIASGTPEAVAKVKGSHTGRFLKPLLKPKK